MSDGSAYVRYIHSEPPNGMLETEHLIADEILRYHPKKFKVRPEDTVQETKIEQENVLDNTQQMMKLSEAPAGKFIQPPWEATREETLRRTFAPVINWKPNTTPLMNEKVLR